MESRNIWKFCLNKSFSIKHYKAIRYLWFRYGLSLFTFEWYLCTVFGVGFPPLLQWSLPVPANGYLSIQALSRDGIFICTSITQRWDLCLYKHYLEMGSLSVQALPRDGIFVCTSITQRWDFIYTSIAQRWDLCLYKHYPEMGSLSVQELPREKGPFFERALSRGGIFEPALLRERTFFCSSLAHARNIFFTIMAQRKDLFLYKHLTEKESFYCTSIAQRMNRIGGTHYKL